MGKMQAEIRLDLSSIAPDLIVSHGDHGYADWGAELVSEIEHNLRPQTGDRIGVHVERIPLTPPSSKSPAAVLALGSLAVVVSAATGFSADLPKVKKLVEGIWSALRRKLPKGTTVRLKFGSNVIDVKTDTEGDARSLLKACIEVLKSLESDGSRSNVQKKHAVTLTPHRR